MAEFRDPASNQLIEYKNNLTTLPGTITTSVGCPIGIEDAIQTVGPRGPATMQDFQFFDDMGHFDRERIPNRVVNAKGSGAFGYFEVINDISEFCAAKIFEKVKKRCAVAVRFSSMISEAGTADTIRDPRGFAVKFYTDEGIWDLVGNNFPVFYIRDPMLFPSFVHSQSRNPQTNVKDPESYWDFLTLRPESTHLVAMVFSDRGTPDGYRHQNGYGGHTYRLINAKGDPIYAKFHWQTNQGIKNLDVKRADELASADPDYATRDLFNAIKNGNYPCWTLKVQFMTCDEAKKFKYNPFDITKIWPHKEFPLVNLGVLVLDRNPTNYFAEIEQLAFSPANLVPGIEPSADKVLQGRMFAYGDAQRYRLGVNYNQIPVNCPYKVCVRNYQRDGKMVVNCNQGNVPNYFPNSFDGPQECPRARTLMSCCPVNGDVYRFSSGDTEDNFGQVTDFWVYVLDRCERKRLVRNIAESLSKTSLFIQERAIRNFTMVHADFGRLLTEALDLARYNKEQGLA